MRTTSWGAPGLGPAPEGLRAHVSRPARRVLATALVALLTLGGCGGGGGDAAPGPGNGPLAGVSAGQWVVLGSSTAAGVGAPPGAGWVARLGADARPRGVALLNLARSGLLSTQAMPTGTLVPAGQLPPDPAVNVDAALSHRPSLLLIAFPTNDTVAGLSAAQTLAAWGTIVRSADAAHATTLVLGTQPRAGLDAAQQATLAEIDRLAAATYGDCFVPLYAALAAPDGTIAPRYAAGDGIHLNADGHALVLARVEAAIDTGRCLPPRR